jgi:hypothetical protein
MTVRRKDVPVFGAKYEQAIKADRDGQSSPPATSLKHCFDAAIWRLHRAGELTGVIADVGEPVGLQFDIERVAERIRPKLKTVKAGTELWYDAATVVSYAVFHVACMQNNADAAIDAAFDLGLLVGEAAVQKGYGGAIDHSSAQVAQIGGVNAQKREHASRRKLEWQTGADRIWAKKPGMSRKRVAEIIAKATGENPDTIRRAIHKA